MKKHKNNLDEMQNLKLLQIEHTSCWLAFWGLLAAIYLQMALGCGDFKSIGGESILLLVLSVYLVGGCLKNGIWDRHLEPNPKTNFIISLTAGLAFGLYWFFVSYRNYHKLFGSAATFVFCFISVAVVTFFILSVLSTICKKRAKQLDENSEEE